MRVCEKIGGNIAPDLLRDVDRLPLAGEPRQDFDQPPQETVARNEEERNKTVVNRPLAKLRVPGRRLPASTKLARLSATGGVSAARRACASSRV